MLPPPRALPKDRERIIKEICLKLVCSALRRDPVAKEHIKYYMEMATVMYDYSIPEKSVS